MGIYAKFILPHLLNFALSNKVSAHCRSKLVPQANGAVLEVGIGSGLNLPFYSDLATRVWGVDPSQEMLRMARKRAEQMKPPVQLINAVADKLPWEDQTMDTIVMTWTLCSLPDPHRALLEMRRVLKPGAILLFIEHGLAPDGNIRRWQDRMNRPWQIIAGGCNLNRPVDRLISAAGFRIRRLDTAYLPGPKICTFMYSGCAERA